MRRLVPMMVLLAGGAWTTAQAAHFGASFVNTEAEFREAVDTFTTDDTSYKLYAGLTAFKFIDLEVSYRELGRHVGTAGTSRLAVDLEVYDLSALVVLPVGQRLAVFARGGYANVSQKGELDLDGVISSIDDDEWELTYGAGLELKLGKRFGLRAEWEEFDAAEALNSLSAGLLIRF